MYAYKMFKLLTATAEEIHGNGHFYQLAPL
jgi:hypothetical protein